jgi:hypothetical protein
MTETRRHILGTIRSVARVSVVTGLLWATATEFDQTEMDAVVWYAVAELGLRASNWKGKAEPEE